MREAALDLVRPDLRQRSRVDVSSWLLAAYLGFAFIGTHPLSEGSAGDRLEGSPLDRLIVLGQFAAALALLWGRRRVAWTMLRDNLGLLAVLAFSALSVVWSDYPDLTLRRALLFLFTTTTAAAIVACAPDPRRLHTALFACLTVVVLANLAATAAAPGQAITDIGVRGLYTQKNVAGYVAMLTLILGAAWTFGARPGAERRLGALALAPTILFLLVSRSKTSMGLAFVALAVGGALFAAARLGRRFGLIALGFGLIALAAAALAFALSGFNVEAALDLLVGDASFTGRDELWGFAYRQVLERPWLGHGYGAFWDVGAVNDPIAKLEPGTWLGDTEVGTINQAHNGYLELALHIGIPMTIAATLVVLGGALRAARSAFAFGLSRGERAAHAGLAAVLFIYLLHNLTEATLFMRGSPFWALASLALLNRAAPRPSHLTRMKP